MPADQLLVAGQHLDADAVTPRLVDQLADLPARQFARGDQHLATPWRWARRQVSSSVPMTGTPPIRVPQAPRVVVDEADDAVGRACRCG